MVISAKLAVLVGKFPNLDRIGTEGVLRAMRSLLLSLKCPCAAI